MMEHPRVSVSIITYNQVRYIRKAIESVLAQEVDFPIEIIIGDDFSTDGTREILIEYQAKYPDKIFLILHPRRYEGVPGRLNNITNLYTCRGQYIALLEGDDYWADDGKLQRQVDFLDQHPDYVLSFHDALMVWESEDHPNRRFSEQRPMLNRDGAFSHEQLAEDWLIPTGSLVFRNSALGEFPDWFWEVISADYALILLISRHGKAFYFHRPDSIYRQHETSFMNVYYFEQKNLIQSLKDFETFRHEFKAVENAHSWPHRWGGIFFGVLLGYLRKGQLLAMLRFAANRIYAHPYSVMYMAGYLRRELPGYLRRLLLSKLFRSSPNSRVILL
ncbi:MAG: glycosyltransferase [Saprospiraceae bacterium]|nr:glycosyltransferase [Saprospiraceae bacterium]